MQKNGLKNRNGMPRRIAAFLIVGLCAGFVTVADSFAQDFDTNAHRLNESQIPTPSELVRKLRSLKGINLQPSPSQKLQQMGEQLLKTMPELDQQRLRQLAEQVQSGEVQLPKNLERVAEQIQQQLDSQGADVDLDDLLKQLPINPDEIQNQLQGMQFPGATGQDPDNGTNQNGTRLSPPQDNGRPTGGDTTNNSNGGEGNLANPGSANNFGAADTGSTGSVPGQSGVPEGPAGNTEGSAGNPGQSGNQGFDLSGSLGLDNPEQLEQFAERIGGAISDLPNMEIENQPNGEMFQPPTRPNEAAKAKPGEDVRNRFDRLILDAVENSLDNIDPQKAEGLTDSFGNALSGLFERMQDKMPGRDNNAFSDSFGDRLSEAVENGSSNSGWSERWSASDGNGGSSSSSGLFSGGSGGGFSGANPGAIGWLIAVPLGLILIGFLLFRYLKQQEESAAVKKFISGGKVRVSRIQSSSDLVKAVDALLLTRFGRKSSWWHSRRAEVALVSDAPNLSSSIGELVDCYEHVRYSKAGSSVKPERVERCKNILSQLSETKREESPPSMDNIGEASQTV